MQRCILRLYEEIKIQKQSQQAQTEKHNLSLNNQLSVIDFNLLKVYINFILYQRLMSKRQTNLRSEPSHIKPGFIVKDTPEPGFYENAQNELYSKNNFYDPLQLQSKSLIEAQQRNGHHFQNPKRNIEGNIESSSHKRTINGSKSTNAFVPKPTESVEQNIMPSDSLNGKHKKMPTSAIKSEFILSPTTPEAIRSFANQTSTTADGISMANLTSDGKSQRALKHKKNLQWINQQQLNFANIADHQQFTSHTTASFSQLKKGAPMKAKKSKTTKTSRNSTMMILSLYTQTLKNHMKTNSALGPGAYNIQKEIGEDAPKFTFKGRTPIEPKNENPGPGTYEPKDNLSKERVKSPDFKGGERFGSPAQDQCPGPGNYYRELDFARKVPPISLKGKANDPPQDKIPGPGTYNPQYDLVKNTVKVTNMNSSQRPLKDGIKEQHHQDRDDSPGPGAYDYQNKSIGKDAPSFSLRGRSRSTNRNQNPGPGTYEEVRSQSPAIKFSWIERQINKTPKSIITPFYDFKQKSIGTDGPKYSLGAKAEAKINNDSPGPGNYDAKIDIVRATSPSFRLRSKTPSNRLSNIKSEIPGPGTYQQVNSFGSSAPKISLKGRPESKQTNAVPGPGSYQAQPDIVKQRILSYKLGCSKRKAILNYQEIQNPGPGHYDQGGLIGKDAPSITLKQKIDNYQEKQRSLSPGPGQYTVKEDITKNAVLTTTFRGTSHQEIIHKHQISLPGPGTYDQHSQIGQNSPSIALKGKAKERQLDQNPGPGSYDASNSFTIVKDRSPSVRMIRPSMTNRSVMNEFSQLPGPGQYSPQKIKNSLSFSLSGKPPALKPDDIPGPGQYDQTIPHLTRHQTPSIDFSKSPERNQYGKPKLEVGPGQYDVQDINDQQILSTHSLISYRFPQGQVRKEIVNQNPGPGTYELPSAFNVLQQRGSQIQKQSQGMHPTQKYK